jgi:NAD(P)-dependent dehydrogenase (short-subunit alcohol dehydrogenase family)
LEIASDLKEATKVDMGLTDKLALVAGGSRGIGKAIALDLAREGADVAIAARNADQLERTAAEIRELTGRRAIPLVFDATSTEQSTRMVDETAAQLGGLHILVNSASLPGGSPSAVGPVETVDEEDLLRDFDVKYVGALRCAKAAIPHIKQQGWGRIINISGTNARRAGNLSGGARNTSMVHLTKTLALQLGQFGITVNCIHPGTTRTERTPGMLEERGNEIGISADEVERRDFAPGSPAGNAIGRMVDADEVAYVTTFLASDKAWAVTGELIVATGGAGNFVYY